MHRVAECFSDLFADILAEAEDVAGSTHLHYLAVVGHPVEGGVNSQSPFAKECLYVEWHLHVSSIHILVLQYDCVELERIHIEFRLFRSGEGSLYHGHMGEIIGVGEGDGTCRADAAASLTLDADAVECGCSVARAYASHWTNRQTTTATCASVGIARWFCLEEASRGAVRL